MLAGVLDAPPPKRVDPPVLPPALPNRFPLLGAPDVLLFVVPKRPGVPLPLEGVAPNRGLLGVLLPPLLGAPNVKPDILAVVEGIIRVGVAVCCICCWLRELLSRGEAENARVY